MHPSKKIKTFRTDQNETLQAQINLYRESSKALTSEIEQKEEEKKLWMIK